MYNKNEKEVDFSDKIAMSKMTKEAMMDMEKSEAMKFNVFLKKCIPTKSGTDKEKFGSCLMEFKKMKKSDAGRPGPKSGAQTPAKPDERKKGSKANPPGSAGTKPDSKKQAEKVLKRKDEKQAVAKITFSEKTTQALKNKVAEHNKKYSRKVTLGQLKKVYRRGAGAFSASHRPGQSRNSWAMARVNMFLKMMRGGKVKDAYRKADRDIAKASEMTYDSQGEKKAPLNKPFRTPKGPKKFSVYVKNEKGNVVKVNFGDPNMEIKRDDPDRRKSFRARHNCDNPGPKTKARYWSCRMWESKKSVTQVTKSSVEEPFYADFLDLDLQDHILEVFPEYASAEVIDPEEDEDCGCGTGCGCEELKATHDGVYITHEPDATSDYEISMMKAQLKKAYDQIGEIVGMLDRMPYETNVEAWLQSKVTKLSDYTNSVHSYMKYYEEDVSKSKYNMDEDDMRDMEAEASLWENIRKKKQRMGDNYRPAKPGDKDYPSKEAIKRAKGSPDVNKHYFENEKDALEDAKKLGLKGVHTHKTKDGKTLYMAGPDHETFMKRHTEVLKEKAEAGWSTKYKKSIDCDNPKGFSQKQYCERQKRGGAYKTESKYEQMFNDLENK